ncbi:MAG: DNA replication/repair protein RecF [Chlamydiales bacterium]|nr:DNA replication/repair protein RecF [Chlamydiales bacterium]
MYLKSFYLRNFRNYEEAVVAFAPGLNVIYGDNAQGKTNLLEAIHLLITGRSFRTHHMRDLIRFQELSFYLEAHFEKNGVEQILKLSFNGVERTVIHNATPLPSLSALLGIINGVIISPEDYELVKGGPVARRQFLDLQIACESPLYLYHLSRYTRAMKQRNALLRRKTIETIEIWEEQMAESAAFLTRKRWETVGALEKEEPLKAHVDSITLSYQTGAPKDGNPEALNTYFLKQYKGCRPREIEQGSTLVGPHRDDLIIRVGGQEARYFASEGQTRSCATGLRLAQWARLKDLTKETPILCVDDVGISLDASREEALYNRLGSLGQVFITSPKSLRHLPSEAHLIGVKGGSFTL